MKPTLDIDTQLATMEADQRLGLGTLPRITSQQRVYVAARVAGLSVTASAKEAGCSRSTAANWEQDSDVQAHMDNYMREMEQFSLPRVKFGVGDAHAMYMKAYHMSATSAEMTKATDSLVKLHRLGDVAEKAIPKSVTARQLADLPVAELMRLAGLKIESLAPGVIEGDYEVADE